MPMFSLAVDMMPDHLWSHVIRHHSLLIVGNATATPFAFWSGQYRIEAGLRPPDNSHHCSSRQLMVYQSANFIFPRLSLNTLRCPESSLAALLISSPLSRHRGEFNNGLVIEWDIISDALFQSGFLLGHFLILRPMLIITGYAYWLDCFVGSSSVYYFPEWRRADARMRGMRSKRNRLPTFPDILLMAHLFS